ncbi:Flp pilus assembly protein TadG [Massilia sp. MP_M2]
MAIIAPVLMLVLVGIIEMSMMFFATLTMQYAVREGARFAITGRANEGGTSTGQRYATVIAKIRDNSLGMYERTNCVVSVNGKRYASTSYSNAMFGGAGEMVVLQLNCAWPVTTPLLSAFFTGGQNSFAVGATMRNEYF